MKEVGTGVIEWLLGEDEPSVRYFTLVHLLDRPVNLPEVRKARAAISNSATVRAIIAAQHPEGYWAKPDSTYWPKYTSTIWQLIILSELGLTKTEPAVQKGVAYMQEAIAAIGAPGAYEQGEVIWCYSGNVVRFLNLFGYDNEPATRAALARLMEAIEEHPGWGCRHNDDEAAACLWGAVKVLRALATVPSEQRTPRIERVIADAAERLLSTDYVAASASAGTTENGWVSDWLRFGFPSFYESDLLEALLACCELGCGSDPRAKALWGLVESKRQANGRWRLENSFNGRMHTDIEALGQPSKWITLRALRVQKYVCS
ncbi:MAG: hypothetical protein H5T64_08360 [Chloroflexi bacterium]|nr:hypothetical protein [Chloroflexota bacterium]